MLDVLADPVYRRLFAAQVAALVGTGLFTVALALKGLGPRGRERGARPAGLLERTSDRPALFAAQFVLSHARWLVAYPLAGWTMAHARLVPTLLALAALATTGLAFALRSWPAHDPEVLEHRHDELAKNHPHLADGRRRHAHAFVIDDEHERWPSR